MASSTDRSTPILGAGSVLRMIRDGEAVTRADLARRTGLARSTVAQRVDALLAAVSRIVAPTRVKKAPTLVDPLSPREVTVLRYLCSRLTYQEIAAALFVSLNTLKSHVRAVYRKLDVATRADAVDAGRRLGLI